MSRIRLTLKDDHQVVINGLKSMLAADPGLQVDFTTQSGEELLTYLQTARCIADGYADAG